MRTFRTLLLTDGSSDEPLGQHLAELARIHGVELDVVVPDLARLPNPPGHAIGERLARVLQFDAAWDVLIVHRDAEAQQPAVREEEVRRAVAAQQLSWPVVTVIPVRMTEAWLLLDESALRVVAGRPHGGVELKLPQASDVERIPDPKSQLRELLAAASGTQGRRLRKFQRDFPFHRRQLLHRLDREGAIRDVPAWSRLEETIAELSAALRCAE